MKTLAKLIGICFLSGSFASAHAAGFVRFEGIDGESIVEGYEHWSEFLSVAQEIAPSVVIRGEVPRLAPEFQEISLIKALDKASTRIAQLALKRTVVVRVEIDWTRNINGAEKPYYQYDLRNATVTEYTSTGFGDTDLDSTQDNRIKEKISLDFEDITVRYLEYDEQGNVSGTEEYTWDNELSQFR